MDNGLLDSSPMHLLHRAGQCADEMFLRLMPKDVTPRQLAVLMAVADQEGVNQKAISKATGVDRSTLAEIVRRLVRRKLLQRRRTRGDARAYAVNLTAEGWQVLRVAEPFRRRVDEHILDVLPSGRREQFIAALLAIVGTLDGSQSPQASENHRLSRGPR